MSIDRQEAPNVEWTLITVTYNSAEALQHFVARPIPANVEWLVVDNASQDDSVAAATELGARVYSLPSNQGFSAANNVGLSAAKGLYVAFVNPDVTVDYEDLQVVARYLDDAVEPLLVAPQLLDPDGTAQPSGRGVPSLRRKVAHRLTTEHKEGYRIFADSSTARCVSWAMGAAIMGHRSTLAALGGWDERFFVYYEDHDLGLRAWRQGVPVVLMGDVRWTHGWARETSGRSWAAWKLELHGMAKFFSRYPSLLVTRKHLGPQWSRMYADVGSVYPSPTPAPPKQT